MADVYEMPTPRVPADPELDDLADRAQAWATSTEVAQGARQCLRLQAAAIRALRIRLAAVESKLESTEAIAAIARDERTADQISDSCPGVGCPPVERSEKLAADGPVGICPICDGAVALDGEVIGEHPFAPDHERTADQISDSCPGVGCPPQGNAVGQFEEQGRCPICDAVVPMDGEVIGEHTFAPDPPVPAS